jgi:hypothetical protein
MQTLWYTLVELWDLGKRALGDRPGQAFVGGVVGAVFLLLLTVRAFSWLVWLLSAPSHYEVTGTVTYNGVPVPAGFVVFSPDETKNNSGYSTSAEIRDGKYATTKGRGVRGGPYIATINAYDGQAIEDKEVVRPEGKAVVNPLGKPLVSGFKTSVDLPKENSEQNFTLN